MGTDGMRWKNLSDGKNGMRTILIIMFVEWVLVLPVAYYKDQVVSSRSSVKKSPPFFLENLNKHLPVLQQKLSFQRQTSKVFFQMEKPDVGQEEETGTLRNLQLEGSLFVYLEKNALVCCLNGAGKTSCISMVCLSVSSIIH
ncbi:Abc transporter a family member 7-like [Thalictrum thalictroides]|uniref:Abc transporter a family member 7-like n=1 Tax=Thalictrum thalictroides TaxID=46969 RepID=A0A7J6VUS7_THATH|nr:Abc transporter a family member 7-like [Thalictrum thalictroides]